MIALVIGISLIGLSPISPHHFFPTFLKKYFSNHSPIEAKFDPTFSITNQKKPSIGK